MTERRETGQGGRKRPPKRTTAPSRAPKASDWSEGERIAKYLARAGVASRRQCEALIEEGKVFVDGKQLTSPAYKVTGNELIKVRGRIIGEHEPTRLWRYHKPAGLITSNGDPEGRRTIFDELPKGLPRVVTVGRLDLNTEGLLLLTNDGGLARKLELPKNELQRTYRARAHGIVTEPKLAQLKEGITVEGVQYSPIIAEHERETGANNWLIVTLSEGKKREVRRALEAVDLIVNRLIRIDYGPFSLSDLRPGAVDEVPPELLQDVLGELGEEFTYADDMFVMPAPRPGSKPKRTMSRKYTKKKPDDGTPKGEAQTPATAKPRNMGRPKPKGDRKTRAQKISEDWVAGAPPSKSASKPRKGGARKGSGGARLGTRTGSANVKGKGKPKR